MLVFGMVTLLCQQEPDAIVMDLLSFLVTNPEEHIDQNSRHTSRSRRMEPSFRIYQDISYIYICLYLCIYIYTVDGRNPAPVDMVNHIPLFTVQGFIHSRCYRISSINSMSLFKSLFDAQPFSQRNNKLTGFIAAASDVGATPTKFRSVSCCQMAGSGKWPDMAPLSLKGKTWVH